MHATPSRPHTLTTFTAALDQLRSTVLLISSLTRRNLQNSIRGLIERDDDWCNNSIADDEEIDLLGVRILPFAHTRPPLPDSAPRMV